MAAPSTRLPLLGVLVALSTLTAEELRIGGAEIAGISRFRAFWDTPLVLDPAGELTIQDKKVTDRGGSAMWTEAGGAFAVDALNRNALVRFPDAAERIAAALAQGQAVVKVEVILPWRDDEIWPPGRPDWPTDRTYNYRANWGTDVAWANNRPTWHVAATAVRRPWVADAEFGPTLNAAVNGRVFWTQWDAQDPAQDHFPIALPPVEVSHRQTAGALDVTALLADPAYGATVAERLRIFSDCGLKLAKWETYDHRYFNGVYEWSTGTGGRAIVLGAPELVVTLAPAPAQTIIVPPAVDPRTLPKSGAPTVVLPDVEQIRAWVEQWSAQGHPDMPAWQQQRAAELAALSGRTKIEDPLWYLFVAGHLRNAAINSVTKRPKPKKGEPELPPLDVADSWRAVYLVWIDSLIARPPRGWSGFEAANAMTEWHLGRAILPGPAEDAIRRYWTAWLMPEREAITDGVAMMDPDDVSGLLVHPMADQLAQRKGTATSVSDTYFAKTNDWRGNKSFFRGGFNYVMSTQNFNTTAASGALLAGSMLGAAHPMTDGRNGVEEWLARQWAWGDGSTQEHIDHYYFSVTMKGAKSLVDYAPTPYDRLLAESVLIANLEEMLGAWHPGLRRFVAGSSRTSLQYLLGTQDGLHFMLHSLSKEGALTDVDSDGLPEDMPVWGNETPASTVALQLRNGPYGPDWATDQVDAKSLPATAWHRNGNAVRYAHLGRQYGLFSRSDGGGRIDVNGQWRRAEPRATSMRDLVLMDLRYQVNDSRFTNSAAGWIARPGSASHLQQGPVLLTVCSPRSHNQGIREGGPGKDDELRSLQTAIALFNYAEAGPSWTIRVDGEPVTLPARLRQGQVITIEDGLAYAAFIPLPATDLGRDAEVIIRAGEAQKEFDGKLSFTPALIIESFNMRGGAPAERDAAWWHQVDRAYGGFVTIFGDAHEHGSMDAFQQAVAAAQVTLTPSADGNQIAAELLYAGKRYAMDVALAQPRGAEGGWPDSPAQPLRLAIDGEAPFAAAVTRDTPVVQYGRERAEKDGAILTGSNHRSPLAPVEGRIPDRAQVDQRAHLAVRRLDQAGRDAWIAWNPLPDLCDLRLDIAGVGTITSDAHLGLARITVDRAQKRVDAEIRYKPGQEKDARAARHLLITGCDGYVVRINGVEVAKTTMDHAGTQWSAYTLSSASAE